MIDTFKAATFAAFGAIAAYFEPIERFLQVVALLYFANLIVAIVTDKLKNSSPPSIKKLFQFQYGSIGRLLTCKQGRPLNHGCVALLVYHDFRPFFTGDELLGCALGSFIKLRDRLRQNRGN